jgi:hypothetical protein
MPRPRAMAAMSPLDEIARGRVRILVSSQPLARDWRLDASLIHDSLPEVR